MQHNLAYRNNSSRFHSVTKTIVGSMIDNPATTSDEEHNNNKMQYTHREPLCLAMIGYGFIILFWAFLPLCMLSELAFFFVTERSPPKYKWHHLGRFENWVHWFGYF